MDRAVAHPGARLTPALWVVLAVATTVLAAAAAGALRGSSLPALLGTGVTRAASDAAGIACVGVALVGVLLPPPGHGRGAAYRAEAARVRDLIDRSLVALGGSWLALALLGVVFRAADGFGRPVTTLGARDVLAWATQLAAGRGALLTVACAAAVLGCAIARLRNPDAVAVRIVLVIALLGMLTPAVTGHASSSASHEVAVTTVALHVAAAALWVGGLGALLVLLGRRRELLRTALPRFSTLAAFCLVVVTVSGVLTAQVRLGSWAALVGTGYGALVLAKAGGLAVLGGLGLLTRRRMAAGRVPVLRWAGVEVAVMAVTLGLAAALSQTAP
jgi:putative copper resistance protein D